LLSAAYRFLDRSARLLSKSAFRSLNQLEARLDRARFFRASRRHIVNLEMVASVTPSLSGGLTLTLANGLAVEMSRRRAAELKQFLSV